MHSIYYTMILYTTLYSIHLCSFVSILPLQSTIPLDSKETYFTLRPLNSLRSGGTKTSRPSNFTRGSSISYVTLREGGREGGREGLKQHHLNPCFIILAYC